MQESKQVISNHVNAINKFLFVWQFKIYSQYLTWKRIYEELEINDWIKNRAIGGLVGIREAATNIDFSPFIPIAYKCLNDYLASSFSNNPFKLHILGINLYQDRFMISVLEQMFEYYFSDKHISIDLTYDSANYIISSLFKARNIQIYNFSDGNIYLYKSVHHLPENIIDNVYFTPELKEGFQKERHLLSNNDLLSDSSVFIPLNIYTRCSSFLNLTRFCF